MLKIGHQRNGRTSAKTTNKHKGYSNRSPESHSQSPECERTNIIGKKIENSGILELDKEKPEICPRIIFAARPKSSVSVRSKAKKKLREQNMKTESKKLSQNATFTRFGYQTQSAAGDNIKQVPKSENKSRRHLINKHEKLMKKKLNNRTADHHPKSPDSKIDFSISNLSHISENRSMLEAKSKMIKIGNLLSGVRKNGITPPPERLKAFDPDHAQNGQCFDPDSNPKPVPVVVENIRPSSKSFKQIKSSVSIVRHKSKSKEKDKTRILENEKSQKNNFSVLENKKINNLIYANIKKNKEKQEMENLKRIEVEERVRQSKEMLSERNRKIREMNAKNTSRSRIIIQENSGDRQNHADQKKLVSIQAKRGSAIAAISGQKPLLTETERRARLGLIFIDMQAEMLKTSGNVVKGIAPNEQPFLIL